MTTTLTLISAKKKVVYSHRPGFQPTALTLSFACISRIFCSLYTTFSKHLLGQPARGYFVCFFYCCCCGCTWRVDKSRDKLVPTLLRGTQALKSAQNCFFFLTHFWWGICVLHIGICWWSRYQRKRRNKCSSGTLFKISRQNLWSVTV